MKLTLPQKKKSAPQATPSMDTLPIPGEVLCRIFRETLDDLNRRCVQGLLKEVNLDILAPVQQAQSHLDRAWMEALAGKAILENFRQAVAQWHGAVIALFTLPQTQGTLSQGRLL